MSAALVAFYVRPMAINYHFKVNNHAQACMALPVNGFGFASLILICGQLWLFANSAHVGVITSVAVVYMGIE